MQMASVCVPALKTISGSPTRQRSTNTRTPPSLGQRIFLLPSEMCSLIHRGAPHAARFFWSRINTTTKTKTQERHEEGEGFPIVHLCVEVVVLRMSRRHRLKGCATLRG